jgi:hypothetical protein
MAVARTKRVIRRDWTRDEVKELKKHSKDKTPVRTVSRALKRTPGALNKRLMRSESRWATATKGSERKRLIGK